MLTPYQFASNSPISGIDLDGLEYATVIYKYYEGKSAPIFEVEWYDDLQHNTYGSKGKGVSFRTEKYDKNKKLISTTKTKFFERSAGIFGILDHGFYYGPTQIEVYVVKKYKLTAVDAVDEAGRNHDFAYDLVGANAINATNSWATIEADLGFLKANRLVEKLGIGKSDPFNGQTITEEEFKAAKRGILYFNSSVLTKIADVSTWMETNYPSLAKTAYSDDDRESNYVQFRNKYMNKQSDGNWYRNENMWKEVGEGEESYWTPKTEQELK